MLASFIILQYSGPVRYYYVRCNFQNHLQECAQLVQVSIPSFPPPLCTILTQLLCIYCPAIAPQRSYPRMREHPHRAVRQQGRGEGPQGKGQADHLPPQEEPAVLRDLRQGE